MEKLQQFQYLSLVNKVTKELETHLKISQKSLAEFIIDKAKGRANVQEFKQALSDIEGALNDTIMTRIWNIIQALAPSKSSAADGSSAKPHVAARPGSAISGLALRNTKDWAKKLDEEPLPEAASKASKPRPEAAHSSDRVKVGSKGKDTDRAESRRDRDGEHDLRDEHKRRRSCSLSRDRRDRGDERDRHDRHCRRRCSRSREHDRRREGDRRHEHDRQRHPRDRDRKQRDDRHRNSNSRRARSMSRSPQRLRPAAPPPPAHALDGPKLYSVYRGKVTGMMELGALVELQGFRKKTAGRRPAKRLTGAEKAKQLKMSGVLTMEEYPGHDEESGAGVLANVDSNDIGEFKIGLNEDKPEFQKSVSTRNPEMSPIKTVANSNGSLQRAAMTQSVPSKERRELKEQQQRTLLEAMPKVSIEDAEFDKAKAALDAARAAGLSEVECLKREITKFKCEAEILKMKIGLNNSSLPIIHELTKQLVAVTRQQDAVTQLRGFALEERTLLRQQGRDTTNWRHHMLREEDSTEPMLKRISKVLVDGVCCGTVVRISKEGLCVSATHVFVEEGKFMKATAFGGSTLTLLASFPFYGIIFVKGSPGPAFDLTCQSEDLLQSHNKVMLLGYQDAPKRELGQINEPKSKPLEAHGRIVAVAPSNALVLANYHGAMPNSYGAAVIVNSKTLAGIHIGTNYHLDDTDFDKYTTDVEAPVSQMDTKPDSMWCPSPQPDKSQKRGQHRFNEMVLHCNANIEHKDQLAIFVPSPMITLLLTTAGILKTPLFFRPRRSQKEASNYLYDNEDIVFA